MESEKLKRPMQSETVGKLADALSKAQGEMESPVPNNGNPFYKSSYADLDAIKLASQQALAKYGLAVIQTTELHESKLVLITTLTHTSGEWIKGEYPIEPIKKDPQSFGSALTYARRYAKLAILDLPPKGEEDDGQRANGEQHVPHAERPGQDRSTYRSEPDGPFKVIEDGETAPYRISFGPYMGKGLSEVSREQLEDMGNKILEKAEKQGKGRDKLPEVVQEFLHEAEIFLYGSGK